MSRFATRGRDSSPAYAPVSAATGPPWTCSPGAPRELATTVEPVSHAGQVVGEVLLTAPAGAVRDHNALWLDPAPELDAAAVHRLLEEELGARGVAHRRLYCALDDADRWAAGLRGRGLERTDRVVMRWPGGDLTSQSPVRVVEADADLAEAALRALRASDPEDEPADADQFAWIVRSQVDLGVTVLVALDDGAPIGAVRIFHGEGLAQVEELDVHPDAQGRGAGRALLAAALARVVDVPCVVLTADPDDWPAQWYARLGFRRLGRSSGFVRAPRPGDA